jgi:hypothetical protein
MSAESRWCDINSVWVGRGITCRSFPIPPAQATVGYCASDTGQRPALLDPKVRSLVRFSSVWTQVALTPACSLDGAGTTVAGHEI